MTKRTRQLLFITVFLTGAIVLIFEVAATRLLSPYYGSSLYVLSSVLSTVLLALSLGYYWGGRFADKHPTPHLLALILSLGGLSMLALLSLSLFIMPLIASGLGLAFGPLLLSIAFFFLPAFLLGVDSPYVIRLLSDKDNSAQGATVGSVFFWSTIGSIVGSLSAGFLLIPHLGLINTLVIVSLVICLWSGFLAWSIGRIEGNFSPLSPKLKLLFGAIIIVAILIGGTILNQHKNATAHLLYERDGLYSNILVYEKVSNGTTYRFLKRDTNHSSAIAVGNVAPVYPYAAYASLYPHFVPKAKNYLVLGGGAFTMPRQIHALDSTITVDTVEIEPFLLPLAYEYFELPKSDRLANYTEDARVFLSGTSTKYDVIFSDVMNSGHFIPPHLATAEFYQLVKEHLSEDGIAFFNLIGTLDTNGRTLTGSTAATIKSVFPNYQLIAVQDRGSYSIQNILFVVRHEGKAIEMPEAEIFDLATWSTTTAKEQVVRKEMLKLEDEIIFTDDKAPIEPLVFAQFKKYGR